MHKKKQDEEWMADRYGSQLEKMTEETQLFLMKHKSFKFKKGEKRR